jgi:hypothetical protein
MNTLGVIVTYFTHEVVKFEKSRLYLTFDVQIGFRHNTLTLYYI